MSEFKIVQEDDDRSYPFVNQFDDFNERELEAAKKIHQILVENNLTYEETEGVFEKMIKMYKFERNRTKIEGNLPNTRLRAKKEEAF